MNRIILTGRLGKDPEIRQIANGTEVANISMAVDKIVKGEKKAIWVKCEAWGKTASNLYKYTVKGSKIGVDGHLDVREYNDKQGNKRFDTVVVIDALELLDPKQKSAVETYGAPQTAAAPAPLAPVNQADADNWEQENEDLANGLISGDDLPF